LTLLWLSPYPDLNTFLTTTHYGRLRGLQDIRTTLVVAATGAAANVVLNIVLVYPLGLVIAGSVLGTVLAQLGMAVAYGAVVHCAAREHRVSLRPDLAGTRAAAASVPLLVRTILLRVALLSGAIVAAR